MAGDDFSANIWNRVRAELTNPWDWVAATGGAAAGLVASAYWAFSDPTTVAGAGAMAAVAIVKAGNGVRQNSSVIKRFHKLRESVNAELENSLSVARSNENRDYREHDRLDNLRALERAIGADLKLFEAGLLDRGAVARLLDTRLLQFTSTFPELTR